MGEGRGNLVAGWRLGAAFRGLGIVKSFLGKKWRLKKKVKFGVLRILNFT